MGEETRSFVKYTETRPVVSCPFCDTENRPDAKCCFLCGAEMTPPAEVNTKEASSWWQRFFGMD